MFRVAHLSSSGALNCICSLWFIYPCDDRPLPRLSGKWIPISHSALATVGHHMGITTRGCKYSLELLNMSGVPLETCWAFKKLWNNKFYYKAASCWYFYWVIYDARIHDYRIEEDLQIMGVRRWRKQCEERTEWKKITEKAKTHSGL